MDDGSHAAYQFGNRCMLRYKSPSQFRVKVPWGNPFSSLVGRNWCKLRLGPKINILDLSQNFDTFINANVFNICNNALQADGDQVGKYTIHLGKSVRGVLIDHRWAPQNVLINSWYARLTGLPNFDSSATLALCWPG